MKTTHGCWLAAVGLALTTSSIFACSGNSASSSSADPISQPSATEDPGIKEAPSPPGAPTTPAPTATPPTITPACDVLTPRTAPLELYVLPDATSAPFVAAINSAKTSIDFMVYEMGYGPINDALLAKAAAGIKIRAILDVAEKSTNQKYMDKLIAAGANVIWSDTQFTYMHAKAMIIDNVETVISTGNYGESFLEKERNFATRDTDPADVDVMSKLFAADFARTSPDLSCTRLIVSPVNSKTRIVDFVASAKKEIVIESMQFADTDVRNAVVARKAAGVDVRALIADPSWIDTNTEAAQFLAQNQIPARWMASPAVHVKAIVVDGATAYIGSENLSYTSLDKNREVGLLVSEPANVATIKATFEADWLTATSF